MHLLHRSTSRTRNRVALAAAAITLGSTLITAPPHLASAAVEAGANDCFFVKGSPGDVAIVNLTPVGASADGHGQLISSNDKDAPPFASNVNYFAGSTDPNVALAAVGTDGQVCYHNSRSSGVELVADHLGTIDGAGFLPAQPSGEQVRVVDTRVGAGGGRVAASGQLCFEVAGRPGDVAVVNLTPVGANATGHGQLISSDVRTDPPFASNVNYFSGSTDPNVAFASIGADGRVCFDNSSATSVELVADHLGTIRSQAFVPATPSGGQVRLVDTRIGQGGDTVGASAQVCFTVAGAPGDAAVVNLTPVSARRSGHGQLISSDQRANPPLASNVNYFNGSTDPNVAIAKIGADGQVCFDNSSSSSIELVADHLGTIKRGYYTSANNTRSVDTRIGQRDTRPECTLPSTSGFNREVARAMIDLSDRAYDVNPRSWATGENLDAGRLPSFISQLACWEIIGIVDGYPNPLDAEVFVARNIDSHDIVVSFRGTDSIGDIVTDTSVRRVPWTLSSGRSVNLAAHAGFSHAYHVARPQILNVLNAKHEADVDGARVFFTGHSLGGALATLASLDLLDELEGLGYDRSDVVTYTFGAPRSMSEELSDIHHQLLPNTYAIVSPRDLVSHVPTPIDSLPNPFSHVRNVIVLHAERGGSLLRVNTGDGRDYRACPPPMWAPDLSLTDHDRDEYSRRLRLTNMAGLPDVSVSRIDRTWPQIDDIRFSWDAGVEGPCDQVALWNRSSRPTSISGAVRDRYVSIDFNDQHSTLLNVDDANWVGYVDMFGEVIVAERFSMQR